MIDKSIINRRFVRIKAIQHLYAFYINQQANWQHALEEVKAGFVPDIFASIPANKEQLAQEKVQAMELFIALKAAQTSTASIQHDYSANVNEVVKRVWANYKLRLAEDVKILENGWKTSLDKIFHIYLLILQLVIEWFGIAQQQVYNSNHLQQSSLHDLIGLAHNPILEKLQADTTFLSLIQQYSINWTPYIDLVARWYNQFIKKATMLAPDTLLVRTIVQEKQVIEHLVKDVIFAQEDIQNLFNDLDISWIEHKPIVKKLLYQVLGNLEIDPILVEIKKALQIGSNSAAFYAQLINTVLTQDQAMDQLIQQYIQNWPIKRIVLVDRIMIKLALCEMHYLDDTPRKVAINEYIDLAKIYSTPKSSSFINGVLDTIAKTI